MNISHLMRVLGRFRIVVALGLVFTVGLAFLAYVRVDFQNGFKLQYRQAEKWESHAKLWVTVPGQSQNSSGQSDGTVSGEDLATQIAGIATGDHVLDAVKRTESIDHATIVAVPDTVLTANGQGVALPIVDIGVTAPTTTQSQQIANLVSAALRVFVGHEQQAGRIPAAKLTVLNVANQSKLASPRSKTLPIIVFLTGLMATVALVSLLENMRPRVKVVSAPDRLEEEPPASRRSVS